NVAEKLRIQFRLEAFNFFNTPNFRGDQINTDFMSGGKVACGTATLSGGPSCSPGGTGFLPANNLITSFKPNSSFGQATGTKGGREIQYGLKFVFKCASKALNERQDLITIKSCHFIQHGRESLGVNEFLGSSFGYSEAAWCSAQHGACS